MAINPETQYPGKIAPSTPEYPYGAARNITVPGDGTGTPWEAALVNDLFGFQQAVLDMAGIVPSGNPDEVGNSQYLDALYNMFADGSVRRFGAKGDGVTDDTAAIQAAIDASENQVFFPPGVYNISQPIICKTGTQLIGAGWVHPWLESVDVANGGTILKAVDGSYAGAIWSDTADPFGSDQSDFKPMLVLGNSNTVCNLTVANAGAWDAGIYAPATLRCTLDRVTSMSGPFAFVSALFVDMTWSDRNANLISLHPTVDYGGGANEFSVNRCMFEATYCINIHGTTRDPDLYTSPNWLWGWAGASDFSITDTRLSNGNVDAIVQDSTVGAVLRVDAAVKNGYKAANRIWLERCRFSATKSRYNIELDRVGNVSFINCSGETTSGATNANWVTTSAPFSVTDNTVQVTRTDDTINAEIEYAGAGFARTWENSPTRPRILTTRGLDDESNNRVFRRGNSDTDNTRFFTDVAFSFHNAATNRTFMDMFDGTIEFNEGDQSIRGQAGTITIDTNAVNRLIVLSPNRVDALTLQDGFCFVNNLMRPLNDGGANLGTSSKRWGEIFAINTVINPSDERLKTDIDDISEAEQRVAATIKRQLRKFRWKDQVAEKGDDARIHFGVIAQEVEQAFIAEGLDPRKYSLFCEDFYYMDYSGVTRKLEAAEDAPEGAEVFYKIDRESVGFDGDNPIFKDTEVPYYMDYSGEAVEVERGAAAPNGEEVLSRLGIRYSELLIFIISAI